MQEYIHVSLFMCQDTSTHEFATANARSFRIEFRHAQDLGFHFLLHRCLEYRHIFAIGHYPAGERGVISSKVGPIALINQSTKYVLMR